MANPAMKLDTLAYSKKLIAAGCEPKLAEAHASLQQDVLVEISEDYLSQFATKQDIEILKNQDIANVRHEIEILKQDISAKLVLFDHKIDMVSTKIISRLGALMATLVFMLAAILKIHW